MLFQAPQLSEFIHLSLGYLDNCCWNLFHVLLMIQCNPRAVAGGGSGFARAVGWQSRFFSRKGLRKGHRAMPFHGGRLLLDHPVAFARLVLWS